MDAYILSLRPNRARVKKQKRSSKKKNPVMILSPIKDAPAPDPIDVISVAKPSLSKRTKSMAKENELTDCSRDDSGQLTSDQTVTSLEEIYERKLIQRRQLKREIDQIMAEIIVLQKQHQVILEAIKQIEV